MEVVKIEAHKRTDLGKKATKALRGQGMIPCNLYGGKENINFYAPHISFKALIFTPEFKLVEISLEGHTYRAIMKELQSHPVSDSVIHLDFQELIDDVPVSVQVPVTFFGVPKGAAMGGKVEQTMRKLTISALPKDLPSEIRMDVSDMDFGSIKRIKEMNLPGVTILHSPSIPIARMAIPRAAKEAAAKEAAAAAPAKK
jgi:large subunit ribosomal protein L25